MVVAAGPAEVNLTCFVIHVGSVSACASARTYVVDVTHRLLRLGRSAYPWTLINPFDSTTVEGYRHGIPNTKHHRIGLFTMTTDNILTRGKMEDHCPISNV